MLGQERTRQSFTKNDRKGNAETSDWAEGQATQTRGFNPASSRNTILASLWLCAT